MGAIIIENPDYEQSENNIHKTSYHAIIFSCGKMDTHILLP